MHTFHFGVFNSGKIVLGIKTMRCSHAVAALIVGILDMAKDCLEPGDYFACDIITRG